MYAGAPTPRLRDDMLLPWKTTFLSICAPAAMSFSPSTASAASFTDGRANRVYRVPRHMLLADARTSNLITHLHFEATHDPRGHEHRNLIGIRPYKPVKVGQLQSSAEGSRTLTLRSGNAGHEP